MNIKFTKVLCTTIILVFSISLIKIPVIANDEVKVLINNCEIEFKDQPPIVIDGRTLIPVRGVFEAMQLKVEWNEQDQTVWIGYDSALYLELKIGSNVYSGRMGLLNKVEETFDVPPQLINGRTMLPIRAVVEKFGGIVDWEENTNTVSIKYSMFGNYNSPNVEMETFVYIHLAMPMKDIGVELKYLNAYEGLQGYASDSGYTFDDAYDFSFRMFPSLEEFAANFVRQQGDSIFIKGEIKSIIETFYNKLHQKYPNLKFEGSLYVTDYNYYALSWSNYEKFNENFEYLKYDETKVEHFRWLLDGEIYGDGSEMDMEMYAPEAVPVESDELSTKYEFQTNKYGFNIKEVRIASFKFSDDDTLYPFGGTPTLYFLISEDGTCYASEHSLSSILTMIRYGNYRIVDTVSWDSNIFNAGFNKSISQLMPSRDGKIIGFSVSNGSIYDMENREKRYLYSIEGQSGYASAIQHSPWYQQDYLYIKITDVLDFFEISYKSVTYDEGKDNIIIELKEIPKWD